MIAGKKAENATAFSAFLLDRFAAENIIAAGRVPIKVAKNTTRVVLFAFLNAFCRTFSDFQIDKIKFILYNVITTKCEYKLIRIYFEGELL